MGNLTRRTVSGPPSVMALKRHAPLFIVWQITRPFFQVNDNSFIVDPVDSKPVL